MGRLFWAVSVPIAIGLAFILLFKDIRTHVSEYWKNRGKDRPKQPSTTETIRERVSAGARFLRRRINGGMEKGIEQV